MKEFEYDLVAIGGGTAGLVSAAGAAYLGARAAIIEREALGGDCLWTGCVPSKALIASARAAHLMAHADRFGLRGAAPRHAFAEVMDRMRRARGIVAHHDDPERFRALGIGVHFGPARFVSADTLEVEGVGRVRAPRLVIATGAHPTAPAIPGLAEAGYLTHATIFDQTQLPGSMIVLGGGPIGLELAQVHSRLGSKVTVLEMLPEVLPREDADAARTLRGILEQEGIVIRTGFRATRVEVSDGRKVVIGDDGQRVEAREILVATGRRPTTDRLDLEAAGVERAGSAVRVDSRLRTTRRGIWAAGDVTGGLQFTHVADYMARVVLQNALLPIKRKVEYSNVPWVTFTDPEVAHVGLSEKDAGERGGRSYTYELSDLDRAITDERRQGFVKISADRKGRILGATIVGSQAGEMLFPLVLAKRNGLRLQQIYDTIFPYPTMTEGLHRAIRQYQTERLDGLGGRVLKKVVSWMT